MINHSHSIFIMSKNKKTVDFGQPGWNDDDDDVETDTTYTMMKQLTSYIPAHDHCYHR